MSRVRIKNVSGESYTVEEIDKILAIDEEVDLMDNTLAQYYDIYEAAHRLVSELASAKLYQDIQDGKILVVEDTK